MGSYREVNGVDNLINWKGGVNLLGRTITLVKQDLQNQ